MVRCDGCGALGHSTTQAGKRHLDCGVFREVGEPTRAPAAQFDQHWGLGAYQRELYAVQMRAQEQAMQRAIEGQTNSFAGINRKRDTEPAPAPKASYNEAAAQGLAYYEDLVVANAAIDTLKKDLSTTRDHLRISEDTVATLNRELTLRADRQVDLVHKTEECARLERSLKGLREQHDRELAAVRADYERERRERIAAEDGLRRMKAGRR